jgi:hypothetical protein
MNPSFVCVFLGVKGTVAFFFPQSTVSNAIFFPLLAVSSVQIVLDMISSLQKCKIVQTALMEFTCTQCRHSEYLELAFTCLVVAQWQNAQHPGVGEEFIICSVTIIIFATDLPRSQLCTQPSLPLKT